MNQLVIPASANWYESTILACAPDNTVVYGARNDLVIINPKPLNEPADIYTIYDAHKERVNCVAISPNWSESEKLVASASDDFVVKLWDITNYKEKAAHLAHTTNNNKIVAITFAGNDKIVSVAQNGYIVIWRFIANSLTPLTNLFATKVNITSIATCPHASWLTAFGLNNGLIIITDLRKTGRVMHRLRGHDKPVIGLSWCPTPYNIYKLNSSTLKQDTATTEQSSAAPKSETVAAPIAAELSNERTTLDQHLCNDILDIVNQNVPDDSAHSLVEIADKLEQISVQEVHQADAEPNSECFGAKSLEFQKLLHTATASKKCTARADEENKENNAPVASEISDQPKKDRKPITTAKEKKNPWANLTFACDDENNEHDPEENGRKSPETAPEAVEATADEEPEVDFLSECQALRKHILKGVETSEPAELDSVSPNAVRVTEEEQQQQQQQEAAEEEIGETASCLERLEISEPSKSVPKDFLLASSTRGGRGIIIWRAGSDGFIQDELLLRAGPGAKGAGRKSRNYPVNKSWISLCWTRPLTLLSSSMTDELVMWTLPFNRKEEKKSLCTIHADHKRAIFSIAAIPKLYPEIDYDSWTNEEEVGNVWTMGRDRWIFNTSLEKKRSSLAAYPTCGGQVLRIVCSPLDPNRLAVSIGEQCIMLWDLSRAHLQTITVSSYSQKLNGKIHALAWHPTQENVLAFGNIDGRVATIDAANMSKAPNFMCLHCTNTVYALEWGPLNPENTEELGLYVCAGGKLFVYDTKKPTESPKSIIADKGTYANLFAWKSDYSMLAVGCKDSSVILMNAALEKLTTLYGQQKSINCLAWHPLSTVEDTDVSPYEDYLAVGTTEVEVFVYDCFKVLAKQKATCSMSADESSSAAAAEDEDEAEAEDDGLTVLVGHTKTIKSLAWSPHRGARLVSSGADGITQIWDVRKKTILGTYVSHPSDVLNCVMWSPLDDDLIISGSKTANVKIWRISEHAPQTDVQRIVKKHKIKYLKAPKAADAAAHAQIEEVAAKLDKPKRNVVMPKTGKAQGEKSVTLLQDSIRLYNKRFGNRYEADAVQHSAAADSAGAGAAFEFPECVDLFGTRTEVLELLDKEQQGHSNRFDMAVMLDLMKGTSAEFVRAHLAKGNVNAMVVGVAASVSHALWLDACEAYAKKLADMPRTAADGAMYYLACRKVPEAIATLCDATLYREALAVAKVRLPAGDAAFEDIMRKWAHFSARNGNYELAAQNYLCLGQLDEAAKVLFKRNGVQTLRFAAFLAKECADADLLSGIENKIKAVASAQRNNVGGAADGDGKTVELCKSRFEAMMKKESENRTDADADDFVEVAEEASECVAALEEEEAAAESDKVEELRLSLD